MGSKHTRLEREADRRLAREARKGPSTVSTISALKTAVTGQPKPWIRPRFDMPTQIPEDDLEPLGVDRVGRPVLVSKSHPAWGELVEGRRLGPRDELPFGPVVEILEDDVVSWRTFTCTAPGTLAGTAPGSAPARRPMRQSFRRRVDVLSASFLGGRQAERIVAPYRSATNILADAVAAVEGSGYKPRPIVKPPQRPVSGAAAILERLHKSHAEVRLAADGQHLVVIAQDGRPQAGVRELVELSMRLLVPHLRGEMPECEATAHEEAREATTVLLGGALACAECASGEVVS